ncbi:MAG: CDP-2,3-bis-(O-geranylgeranyl)-sn-glycerol synthase [Candidatus Bathyarchaeia archaeon]
MALILAPAYLANGLSSVFGGGKPLDNGRFFVDGKRILGDGKTTRGTTAGFLAGVFGSLAVIVLGNLSDTGIFYTVEHFLLGSIVALGAILGDLFGAFLKRRIGLQRGAAAPGLDQLGFILFALLFAYAYTIMQSIIPITSVMVLFAVTVTPFIHLLGNIVGFRIGKKQVPW